MTTDVLYSVILVDHEVAGGITYHGSGGDFMTMINEAVAQFAADHKNDSNREGRDKAALLRWRTQHFLRAAEQLKNGGCVAEPWRSVFLHVFPFKLIAQMKELGDDGEIVFDKQLPEPTE